MNTKQKLQAKLAEQAKVLDLVKAGTATPEQVEQMKTLQAEIDGLFALLDAEEKAAEQQAKGAKMAADDKTPAREPIKTNPRDEGKVFKNFGEQLLAVKNAATQGVRDPRLDYLNQAATGSNEGVGSEGGFAVQTDFATGMMESAAKAGQILPLLDRYEVSGGANGVKWMDIDEKGDVSTTVFGGVQVYWAGEAASVTATKPSLNEKELKLEKLMGLAYATYELEADSGNFMSQLYTRAFTLGIQRKLEEAVIAGTGVGQPLGLLKGTGLVTVAKEANQPAATVLWENISKMYNRALNKDRIASYVWLANPDVSEQFDFLSFPVGVGGVPVYLGASSVGSVSTLKGRPVIETDQCAALGTVGDLIFADLSDYLLITKGGVQADTSIHVQFLQAENAFRFIFRANGMPKRPKTMTLKNTSNARSSYVALATRA